MNVGCPVCGGSANPFLNRPSVPVHQNLMLKTAQEARGVTRGRLAMHCCQNCGFVFNAAFNLELLSYGAAYENTQTHSKAFCAHIDSLVGELVERQAVRGCRIVEVGCGNGDFLRRLVGPAKYENTGFGFDPSYNGPENDMEGRLRFFRTTYDERAAELAADVVICRHVIEHVPDPVRLLHSIRRAVLSRSGRVFLETPCVEWILRDQVVWDFFYEHCSLFTPGSLALAFQQAGFEVVANRKVFGNQYLWQEARPSSDQVLKKNANSQSDTFGLATQFAEVEGRLVASWQETASRCAVTGAIAVWGAGAKGATFCNLVDPDVQLISCVVDINPTKQGRFIAGTGHPIVSPYELTTRCPGFVFVLNPNYTHEIARDLASRSIQATVYDLMASVK